MDICDKYEVAVDYFWGDNNDHSWAYIREAGLDFPLVFPEMLIDKQDRVRMPLEQTIAEAQKGIDENLPRLTAEQRERFLAEKACVTMVLYPSGDVRMVTMDSGVLRLWDDAPIREAFDRYVDDDPCYDFDWPPVEQEIEAGNVKNFNELMALVWCARLILGDVDSSIHELWGRLRPLIQKGWILSSDVVVTGCFTPVLGYRDRVGECLAVRRLIGEEGWEPQVALDVVKCMTLLHFLAGDSGYDLGEELVACGDVLAEVLGTEPKVWGMPRISERLEHMALGIGWVAGMEWRDELYERDVARYADGVHEVIRALHTHDVAGAREGLRSL